MERARTGRSTPLMVSTEALRPQPGTPAHAPPAAAAAVPSAGAVPSLARAAAPPATGAVGKKAARRGIGLGSSFLIGGLLALIVAVVLGGALQPSAVALAPVLARLKALEYAAAQAMAAANTAYADAHQQHMAEAGLAASGDKTEEPEIPVTSPGHEALANLRKAVPEVPKWAGVHEALVAHKESQWRSWGTRKAVAVAVGATYGRKDKSLESRLGMEKHECLLEVKPVFEKFGEDGEVEDTKPWEAGGLQKVLVGFLRRCPAGVVIMKDCGRAGRGVLNPLHTAISEGGSFMDEGEKVPAWDAVFFFEYRLAWNQEWLHDVPRATGAIKDAVVGPWGGHSMGGSIFERSQAFRRRIDFAIPLR